MEYAIFEKVMGDQNPALKVLSIIKVEHIQNYCIRRLMKESMNRENVL